MLVSENINEKQIGEKILNALTVFPGVVEKSKQLLPQLKNAQSDALKHTEASFFSSTKDRRRNRSSQLNGLVNSLENIIRFSNSGKNKLILKAIRNIQKKEEMITFSAIEKGTEDPKTGKKNENPLNRNVIMEIQKFLGGKRKSKCKKMKGKKYNTRKSPAYSASKCAKGTKKKGNDGKMYIVKSSKNGVKRWIKSTRQNKKSKTKKTNKH